jgi:predicted nucleic acid-binding protein
MPAVVLHELRFGVELLPPGRRRDRLSQQVDALAQGLGARVLAYTGQVAQEHARLRAAARAAGRELSAEDGQIAAHAAALDAPLATRNVEDFAELGDDGE